ncbi:MAG: DUF503 domain-containing protein [Planctomycetes bacterium]|jgi:uncharacterized protein YlxP (DUF503 family)|nr:DUF503 domain-containing protein [Planctomycetota bacterium]
MFVAIMQVELELAGARNLKERRNILNSLKGRLRGRFMASVAEVGLPDAYTSAALGIALVSNDAKHVRERSQKILEFLENAPDSRVTDSQTEVI